MEDKITKSHHSKIQTARDALKNLCNLFANPQTSGPIPGPNFSKHLMDFSNLFAHHIWMISKYLYQIHTRAISQWQTSCEDSLSSDNNSWVTWCNGGDVTCNGGGNNPEHRSKIRQDKCGIDCRRKTGLVVLVIFFIQIHFVGNGNRGLSQLTSIS